MPTHRPIFCVFAMYHPYPRSTLPANLLLFLHHPFDRVTAMSSRHASRRQRLLKSLRETGAAALLVTGETNVRYLTGFTGDSSYLLLAPGSELLISDSRYETQIAEECPGLEASIRTQKTKMVEAVAAAIGGFSNVGFEASHLSVASLETIEKECKTTEWLSTEKLVENLRSIKDAGEIAEIREAVRLAERALHVLVAGAVPELTEIDAAHEMENALWRFGAGGLSFPAILAAGDRAALPHYQPAPRRIGDEKMLLVDWGARGPGGYVSDLTRTFALGKVSAKLRKVHETVLRAQEAAIAAIRPGAKAADVDAAARGVIEQAGYGKRFGHGLGHGIGLEVHEAIRMSAISEDVLQPGMVVTVEPGIYLPGWGGVRIEDDVLVTRDGHEVLSTFPRELEVLALS